MVPTSLTDIVLLPTIFLIIGGLVYILPYYRAVEDHTPLPKARWVGVAFLLLGLFAAGRTFWDLVNPDTGFLYRAAIFQRSILWSHYLMPFLALFGLALVFFLERRVKRRNVREEIF